MDKKIVEEKTEQQPAAPEQIQEKEIKTQESIEIKESVGALDVQKIRAEIENTPLDDGAKMQAQSSAQDIQALEAQAKIKKLLELVKIKGVVYAVHVAKKMNDAYVLDMLHDEIIKSGLYHSK